MPANPDSLDLVQLEKQESAGLGGDAADELPFAAPIEPQEDAIEVAGVMLQETGRRDRQLAIWPDGNDMRFRDIDNPGTSGEGHTLTELLASGGPGGDDEKVKVSSNDTTSDYLLEKFQAGANISLSEVDDGADEKVEIAVTGLTSGAVKYHHLIWAEENGGIADGQHEWSYGNGATGVIGIPVFKDGEIVGMTYNAETAGDAMTEIEVRVNGATVSASITPGNGNNDATVTFGTPVSVSAGDRVGFYTITGGGASDVRVAAVVEYEVDLTAFQGPQGDPGADGVSGTADIKWADLYDSSGGTPIPASWTDVPWDSQRKLDSPYTHSTPSAEVTIAEDGTYGIWVRVSTGVTSGTDRSESAIRIMLDAGSGYAEVPGTQGFLYNRTAAEGYASAPSYLVLDLSAGDKLKVQAQRTGGAASLALLADGSSILIQKIVPGIAAGSDELVKVSANDTSAAYLLSKLAAGTGITITEQNDGGVETAEIAADAGSHRDLDQLVHEIAEDYYEEFTYAGNKITNITHWTDAGKTVKIREQIFTYTGNKVNTAVTKQYDAAGVVLTGETMTETYAYSGNNVSSITAVIS